MQTLTKVLLAAGLTVAGTAAWADSKISNSHEMTVQLPGGRIEHIQYSGNVPPKLVIGSTPFVTLWPAPVDFAQLDRISAELDRRMDQLIRQSLARAHWPDQQTFNASTLKSLPPGTTGYSWSITSTGNGYCTQMVQVTSPANGGKAQVVSNMSGDCSGKSDKVQRTRGTPQNDNGVTPVKLKTVPVVPTETSL